jgi:hypothetical protein
MCDLVNQTFGVAHRWMPVDSAPVLPKQPPRQIKIRPPGALSLQSKSTYLCFTHAMEVTPVLQVGDIPAPSAPGNAHLSVPWMIQCDKDDHEEILKAHSAYWRGTRYDENNVPANASLRDNGGGSVFPEESNPKSKSSCSC